ncbi:type II toxin-antitoxin system HicA family toxin [Kribbella sp. NPDC050124]|uniref:type II toxin-antitoxin system HicA family toxin n=1 Tax=Kribbella sp. NPDC050124 TaxID=3364114 RepID=UPI0037A8D363
MAAPKKRREAERELKKQGFEKQSGRGKGSHEVWKNESGVSVTVPNHGDEIAAGTWRSISRQVGQAAEQEKAAKEAEQAQRLANDGVARPGGGQGRGGSGQQDRQSGKQQTRGRRGGRDGRS